MYLVESWGVGSLRTADAFNASVVRRLGSGAREVTPLF